MVSACLIGRFLVPGIYRMDVPYHTAGVQHSGHIKDHDFWIEDDQSVGSFCNLEYYSRRDNLIFCRESWGIVSLVDLEIAAIPA